MVWCGMPRGIPDRIASAFSAARTLSDTASPGQLPGGGGSAARFGLPLLINSASWNDYFSAMQTHSELYRNDIDPRPGRRVTLPRSRNSNRYPRPLRTDSYADFSAYALLSALGLERSWLGDEAVPAWPFVLAVAVPFSLWLWLSRRQPTERLLPGLAACFFLADLFLPAYRDNYNDVLILNFVALGLIASTRFPWTACHAGGVADGWAVYAFAPEQVWLINLPTLFFTLGAILFLFCRLAKDCLRP